MISMITVKPSRISGTIIRSEGQQQMIRVQMIVCVTAYKYCALISVHPDILNKYHGVAGQACQRWLIQFSFWLDWREPAEQHLSQGGWCTTTELYENTIHSCYILHSHCWSKTIQNCSSELQYVAKGVGYRWLLHLWSSTIWQTGWILHYWLLCES